MIRPTTLCFIVSLPLLSTAHVQAACSFTPGPGNDAHVCDSGSAPSLTDNAGDNSLSFPAGGNGVITGNVSFGDGKDALTMASGEIGGNVDQGGGIDDFNMSGGIIRGNLNQGDGLDTFSMTGGHIVGTFLSGDYAQMTAGRIGNVNMLLDKNVFIMRGGTIDRNISTAFDTDLVEIFAGDVGGNISVSGGDDQVLIHGGRVGGNILLSFGNDRFVWDGGTIGGRVDLGADDDTALLKNLDTQALRTAINGGVGEDTLTFEASQPTGGALYSQFEKIILKDASRLTLNDSLVLGDANSGTGVLTVDPSSSVISRQGSVSPFAPGQNASLINAGTLDLGSGGDAQGRLQVQGNYQGDNGILRINSVLAGDGAASDRLVVSQGTLSGSTALQVTNLAGSGASTSHNGIQVVEAREGATSSNTAFVQSQVLSAGAYDYRLFKGGVTAGSENSWYLRSSLVAAPEAPPGEVAIATPVTAVAPGQAALPTAQPGQDIPLYRPEVALYAAAPRAAGIIVRQALGTFHQRQGDQRLLAGSGSLGASWGQAYGGAIRQQWSGTVSPGLDGDYQGYKVGQDLYAHVDADGVRQQFGVYFSHSRLDADATGFALAQRNVDVGKLRLEGDSVGAYWTRVGAQGSYLDAVLQFTDLSGRARSERGRQLDLDGRSWSGSLEGGYPLALSEHWTLEPQAQLIAQKVKLDSAGDGVAQVSHDAQLELTGRLGARLEGTFTDADKRMLQPYLQLNLWHGDGGRDSLVFDGVDTIKTDYRYTSLQLESGLVAQVNKALGVHVGVQYSTNLDSHQQQSSGINLGLRWQY